MKKHQNGQKLKINNKVQPIGSLPIERSLKISSIVFVQNKLANNSKAAIIQVKPQNKLLYHCYKRFKSFPYTFDHVYEQSQGQFFIDDEHSEGQKSPSIANNSINKKINKGHQLHKTNIIKALNQGLNYMIFNSGVIKPHFAEQETSEQPKSSKDTKLSELSPPLQIFYEMMTLVISNFIKLKNSIQAHAELQMTALSVNEDQIIDLFSDKHVDVRECSKPELSIQFYAATSKKIMTLYELYEGLKYSFNKKNKNIPQSYFIAYFQVINTTQLQKQSIVFIDCTKKMNETDKNWDNNSQLVLNKCILGLWNRQNAHRSAISTSVQHQHTPYRDSKLTRILKPYLQNNSKIDTIGWIYKDDEDNTYQILNFVKNISRIKIPLNKKFRIIDQEDDQQSLNKIKKLSEQNLMMKKQLNSLQNATKVQQIQKKKNLADQLNKICNIEHTNAMQIEKNKTSAKILKDKILQHRIKVYLSVQSSSNIIKLEQEQLQFKEVKSRQAQQLLEEVNIQRIKIIEQAESKTEKLQLMKQYYSNALKNQKQIVQSVLHNQKYLEKVLSNNIKSIERQLKKSPKELLSGQNKVRAQKRTKSQQGQKNYFQPGKQYALSYKKRNFHKNLGSIKTETSANETQDDQKYSMEINKRKGSNTQKISRKQTKNNPQSDLQLPYIQENQSKGQQQRLKDLRKQYIKQKVQKGRVDYSNFLQKNVEGYLSYSNVSKK